MIIRLWAACRKTSVRRTTGTTLLSITCRSTMPGPTDGNWSISPTKSRLAFGGRARSRLGKRPLFTKEELEHLCRVATQKNADGTPKYRNGELLADAIRFMRTTGARVTSALSTRWEDVNWQQRPVHLRNTKYDKNVVVDFSDELEVVLKEMYARRLPDSDCMFPAASDEAGNIGSLRGTFEKVREEAGLPNIHFHDTRHHFISECVMSGVDFMTIARWVGHSDGGMLIGKVYSHLSNEHAQRAAKKVTFGNGGNQPKAAERVSAMDRAGALATTSAPPPPAATRCV